jgi:hypothetical protein
MTNTAMSAPFAEGDFRVGRVLTQSTTVFQRNFLALFIIGAIAYLPIQAALTWITSLTQGGTIAAGTIPPAQIGIFLFLFVLVAIFFSMLSQAVILHVAFQNMRNRPASMVEAFKVGLRRFFPLLLLGICIGLAAMLLIVALAALAGATVAVSGNTIGNTAAAFLAGIGVVVFGIATLAILYAMWFVAVAACVVDRRGPFSSLGRSAQLTKGHRWRVFGLILLLFVASSVVSIVIELLFRPLGSLIVSFIASLAWSAIWGAFYAIVVAVSYHDLCVAKEGMDIEQIASVFD